MSDLYKYISFLFLLAISVSVFAQNEYDDDLDFKALSTLKEKKHFEGKRKFNIHFGLDYNLSTVMGKAVREVQDTFDVIKARSGLDSYRHAPSYFPSAAVDASFNFTPKISLTLGVKYNKIGWREVAKYTDPNQLYRFFVRYDFHYVGLGFSVQAHLNKHFSIYGGQNFSVLVRNDILVRELQTVGGNTLIDTKVLESFSQLTGVDAAILRPQFYIGTHFGFDRLRFNIKAIYTPSIINRNVQYHNVALEAGLVFKLLKDYDNK